jgi:heavy metal translocating P-type ATPase
MPTERTTAPHPTAGSGGARALPEVRWAAVAVAIFGVALLLQAGGAPRPVTDVVYLLCYVAGGWEPAREGVIALRQRSLDVDLLMVVAAVAAACLGEFVDGGLLIVIFATSGAQEAFATMRTADSVRSLLTLAPERATLVAGGVERVVDTATLAPGDVILVRPGERIGADGTVAAGASEIDQATITGEPLPVHRTVGDEVFAGTYNRDGALQVTVTRAAADSVVARIVALVEAASATKARTQLLVERVEQRYSVGVVISTLAVLLVPLSLGEPLRAALLRAMTFMIVASPCAVVLATMPPLLAAIANAGRHGVLVKSAVVMEQLGATGQVAFDKTGTLTRGTPHVDSVWGLGMGELEVLGLAAGAERRSEHPLGRAVVAAALERGAPFAEPDRFASVSGRGVQAVVGGQRVEVGSPLLLAGRADESGDAAVADIEASGGTAVVVLVDDRPVGVIGLGDHLRAEARATVDALAALTDHRPVLLTGDNDRAARRLAADAGIDDVRAALLPAGKVDEVAKLHALGRHVTFVGDGINDAPALAAADIGVAMGRSGSDLALQTADAVIVRDRLDTLPAVIRLSRLAHRAVLQNLLLAAIAIVGLITWDLLGHLPLPLGVLFHEGGTVLVGLNGLRLLRTKAWSD